MNDTSIDPRDMNNNLKENNVSFDPDVTIAGQRVRRERGELQVGDVVLKRYELLEKLGSGAMGVVFKCRDQVSQVEYALKMVPPELARNANAMEDVLENFQLVHGLKHPNIASMDSLDRDEFGAYFLVMEYAPGITLAQWIKQKWRTGQPSLGEVAEIAKQIAVALDYAHQKGILHRDIKPTNIVVTEGDEVKVLDFGLASKVRNTMTAMSINPANTSGTPCYLAPEQFKGRYPTPAADQYALGVLAYQMLSGHLPFDSDDYNVLRSAVVNEPPEEIDDIPDAVDQCIRKALNKDPKQRYASCAEFAFALNSAMDGNADAKTFKCDSENTDSHDQMSSALSEAEMIFQEGERLFEKGDSMSAVIKYHIAADKGNAEASLRLGECYEGGFVKGKGSEDAFKWYQKAAEQGNTEACLKLGYWYDNEENEEESFKWYQKAAEQGNAEACLNLGYWYDNKDDVEESFKWYQKAAEQGNAEACLNLGDWYDSEENEEESFKWYQKAAEQGNAEACLKLGYWYDNDKNKEEAIKWYQKAAEQGNEEALSQLLSSYAKGEGVQKNEEEAIKWYQKAAEQGNADAQFELGLRYASGRGVERNEVEAIKWYQKAAEAPIPNNEAVLELAKRYIYIFKNASFSLEEIYRLAFLEKLSSISSVLFLTLGALFWLFIILYLILWGVSCFTDAFTMPSLNGIIKFIFSGKVDKFFLLCSPLFLIEISFFVFFGLFEKYEKRITKEKRIKAQAHEILGAFFEHPFSKWGCLPWSEIKRLKNAIKEKKHKQA